MDRLDAMAAFVAVADARGFASAGRQLGLSPSGVTRLVAALEDRLSIRLLQRTTRAVTLTDAGARYLERARRILAANDEAEQTARAERVEPTGRFVVAAPLIFGRREVAPLMSDFLARYPAVVGELALADRIVNLLEEGVDAAVRIGELADSSLVVRKVGATRRVVVAAPAYLASHPKLRGPDDLVRHRILQCTAIAPSLEWKFARGTTEHRVPVTPSFVTTSADAAIDHAERGGGLTMVLAYQVADAVRAGRLTVVLPRCEPPPLPIHIVVPSGRLLAASARAFIAMASERDWQFVNLTPDTER